MDLERFHAVLDAVIKENQSNKVAALLQTVITSLQQSMATPTDAALAKAFKDHYQVIITTLSGASSNTYTPIWRKLLDDISASSRVGAGLLKRIEKALNENSMTPQIAIAELTKINDDLAEFTATTTNISTSFKFFKLRKYEIEPGKFELGFSFPQTLVVPQLDRLTTELKELDKTLKTFAEITGTPMDANVLRKISSTEWQFFLETAPQFAACFAVAIERIVHLYKTNLEIKKLKLEMEQKKFPEPLLKSTQEYIDSTIRTELQKIADEIVDEFYKSEDTGRRNELKTAAKFGLIYLADRIDKGATVEVIARPLPAPVKPTTEDPAQNLTYQDAIAEYELRNRITVAVNARGAAIANFQRGDQPILMLDMETTGEDPAKNK